MAEYTRSIRVRCERANLAPLRRFVDGWLQELGVAPRLAGQLLVAVDEVCANVIVHGNQEDPKSWLTLRLRRIDSGIEFELLDRGVPFEPPPFAPADVARYVVDRRKGGLGLTLVHLIMDRVEFSQDTSGANVCRLSKKIALA
ncbi:MAG: ATP-binding protein [Hymenobacteraceae bacterium]|nr:ATP-binding protein [Hymenobacteraceae bacterium]